MAPRIDFVSLFVQDMQRMVAFYKDVLGFETDWDGKSSFAVFKNEGVRFALYERAQLPHLLGQTPDYTTGLNGTFELAIDHSTSAEADKEYQRIMQNGGRSVYPPRDEPWGQHASLIADPEGNLIEIGSWHKGE